MTTLKDRTLSPQERKDFYRKLWTLALPIAVQSLMLAAVAAGEFGSVEEAARKFVHVIDTVEPEPELVRKYNKRYLMFREIYPACKPVYEILAK